MEPVDNLNFENQDESGRSTPCCDRQAKRYKELRRYTTYHYSPLPRESGAIRLLKLVPSNPQNPDLECELIHWNPKDPNRIPYEALSWCWGTEQSKASINIRQRDKVCEKPVAPNLFAALKALRYQHKDRCLWVDAVCIDQEGE